MKKTPLVIGMSIVVLIIVLGGIFYFLNQKEKERQQSLSEMQQVNSTIKETPHALSLEKQKQVEKISELYTLEENKFESTIIETLSQYKADISKEDIVRVEEIIEQSESPETLHTQIQNTLGIPLLKRDIDVLFEAQQNIVDEKELKQDRLSVLYEKNEKEIQENSQRLFTLSLKESFKNYAPNIEPEKTEKIIAEIQEKCFVTYNILDEKVFNSFEKQKNQIESVIISTLGKYTALSSNEKNTLSSKILEELEKLEILQKKSNATSFFEIPSIDFGKILGFFGSQVHAQEVTLSAEERNILILKTQILIDKLIQKGIDIEIDYTDKKLTLEEYNTAVNQNLVEIEELIIFKESLENDASVISLDDIQRFNLGSYVDDSKEIENLPTIAYVQSKSGHIMVYNIHGSTRLGEENDALYSGYGIETLGDSEATIVFSDESILRLEEYSKVILTAPTENNIELTLERGNIWTRVLKPLFSGDVFAIDTGEVSLGVRGTSVYISKSDSTNIQIVDSYDPSGSGSVTLTKKDTGAQTLYTNGKEILVSSGGTISSTSRDRKAILQENPSTVGKYLREDLEYMALLLDDRKRGFYNTPLEKKNNGENFLAKIEGELNSSLPTNTDKSFILENSELLGETINTGSIYGVLKKDEIISQIKKSPFGDVPGKINAIKNTNFQNIEKNLTNKREIENRIDYKIAKKLAKESFLSPTRIEGNFGSFDINTPKNTLDTLQEEKRKLKINSGSNILSTDFYLPGDFSGGKGIITWESSDESVLKIEPDGTRASYIGKVFPEQQRKNVFLTATLSLGDFTKKKDFGLVVVPQILSPENELEAAAKILDDFINNIAQKKFNNFILSKSGGMILTESGGIDFSQSGGIIPIITWTGSSYIGGNGNTHKPDFSKISDVNDIGGYASGRIIAILQHPKNPLIADITREYDVGIKIKKEKADEKLTRLRMGNFWTYFQNSLTVNNFLNGTTLSGTSISLPGDYDIASTRVGKYITGATLKYTVSGSGSISGKILNLTQGTNTGSVTIKPKLYIAGFSGFLSPDKKTYSIPPLAAGCSGIRIPDIPTGDCYELVAKAEYDTAGEYELRDKDGDFITGSVNVGTSVSPNNYDLNNILTQYPTATPKSQISKSKSLIRVGTETGIVIDTDGGAGDTNEYLSYDLSSLGLGTDWAIEMSVRGEDLNRTDFTGSGFMLFGIPGTDLGFRFWIGQNYYSYKQGNNIATYGTISSIGLSNIGYQKVLINKNVFPGIPSTLNYIYIGSRSDKKSQWNGIINYFRIYKKSE